MNANLSRKELERAKQLEGLGIPLDRELIAKSEELAGLSINQDPNIPQTTIFDLTPQKTGVIISMRLMNSSEKVIRLAAARLRVPWSNRVCWLQDPRRESPPRDYYWFAELNYLIDRDAVLNHFFKASKKLFPGDFLEGFLLGTCEAPIPDQYRNRAPFESILVIYDGNNNSYELPLKFLVARDQAPRGNVTTPKGKKLESNVRRKLFEHRAIGNK